ncbi:MAG: hypothetical protein HQL69_11480 [Magnetococcales bacterium]|nr:hypothetical protein [Magnetococcales bacterium]
MFYSIISAALLLLLPVSPIWAGEKEASFKLTGPVTTLACKMCHTWRKPVLKQRDLKAPHNKIKLNHGAGQLWCFSCHKENNYANLQGDKSAVVDFKNPQKLCRTCHFRQVKSWRGGAHGKRTGSWQGERTSWRCTACHNPHSPQIAPFKPSPPPRRPGTVVNIDKSESKNGG